MSSHTDRYSPLVDAVERSVFDGPGRVPAAARAAARDHAARAVSGSAEPPQASGVPDPWARHVDAVVRHAYRITDADIEALKAAGHTDDEIFETTVAAAVGAGVARLERALSLLKEGR
ncbi:MAG TPA: hypothetical protein VF198_06590 [Vicinamibacterales bacterium]